MVILIDTFVKNRIQISKQLCLFNQFSPTKIIFGKGFLPNPFAEKRNCAVEINESFDGVLLFLAGLLIGLHFEFIEPPLDKFLLTNLFQKNSVKYTFPSENLYSL